MVPTMDLVHLGARIHTEQAKVFLLEGKKKKSKSTVKKSWWAAQPAAVQGLMVSTVDVILQSQFPARPLQWLLLPFQKDIARRKHKEIKIPLQVWEELQWGTLDQNLARGTSFKQHKQVVPSGGGRSQGRVAQDKWGPERAKHSVSQLEPQAGQVAPQAFQPVLNHNHVLVQTSSVTMKAHIDHQGGTRSHSLFQEAILLIHWAERNLAGLKAQETRKQTA